MCLIKKTADIIRTMVFVVLILTAAAYCMVELMKIQIVNGEEYARLAQETTMGTQVVNSPRGEIIDSKGNPIVSNKVGFNVVVEKAFFPSDSDQMNKIIITVAEMLEEDGDDWIDTLPISMDEPYEFFEAEEKDISKLRENINIQVYATAEECIHAMAEKYKISDKYTDKEIRIIAGIRYEMSIRDFSVSNRYTFAEDIPMDTVVKLKEQSFGLEGIDVVEEAIRIYNEGDIIPHLIGTVGPINAEEYDILKSKGYALNDTLGKSGIEKAMEDELRGEDGERTISFLNGTVVSDTITTEAVPGNTVKLTVDIDYQRNIQKILENHIYWLQNQTSTSAKGMTANAGAIVVTDVKSGAILAAATNPTYNLNDYMNNYYDVLNGENAPLTNRATSGLYRPGSTFKTVTATAALNEGYIDPNTTVTCNGIYTYWEDYQPKCTGYHGSINVVTALEKSCNIFFYEVGRRMGINNIANYSNMYGLGTDLGLETGGATGWIATPESFEQRRLEWQAGNVVQASIGQSETYITPLQLAVQGQTIANRGVRYRPHIVDSVYTYNMEELISHKEPEVVYTIEDKTGYTYDTVIQGMIQAGNFAAYYYPSEMDYYTDYVLSDLPGGVAIKTGTPQMTSAEDTGSSFVGFYPADNPEIAFSGFIEHGEYSKLMIKQIINAYYNKDYVVPEPIPQRQKSVVQDTINGVQQAGVPVSAQQQIDQNTAVIETQFSNTDTETQTTALTEISENDTNDALPLQNSETSVFTEVAAPPENED